MSKSLNTDIAFDSYANASARYSSLKAEIQRMEGSPAPISVDKLAVIKAEATRVHQMMTRLFFSEHPQKGHMGETKVTRLFAVDPSNHDSDHCLFLSPSDPVKLKVGAHRYNGPADRVEDWAQELGFLTQFHQVSVAV